MIIAKSPEQLAKEDLIRQIIEAAAARLEREDGNTIYKMAWKKGAKLIRRLSAELINS